MKKLTRKETVEVQWVKPHGWARFDRYNCWWCRYMFEGEEEMFLACITDVGNVIICATCAAAVEEAPDG